MELKRLLNRSIVEPLREKTAPGFPGPCPRICVFTQGKRISTLKEREQEIGTWKTSRHKIFRTPS
jgi:hypothetical protein